MIVAGIDVGAKNVHAVLIKDGELVARATVASGFDHEESAERGLAEAAAAAGVDRGDIDLVAATGAGRKALPFAVPVAMSTWVLLAWLVTRGAL